MNIQFNKKRKITISIVLREDMLKRIDDICKANPGVHRPEVLDKILREYFKMEEK